MTVNKYTNISTPYLCITTHLNVNILMVIYQSFQCADFFDHKEESTAPTLINIYIFFYFLPFQNSTGSKNNWLALTVLFMNKVKKTIKK